MQLIEFGSADYRQMVDLRFRILREPLGLTFSQEDLEKEKDDILLGLFDTARLIQACCILTPAGTVAKLRQMAVNPALQGKGAGREMMQFAEEIARSRGFYKIAMHARKTAVGFYQKMGYKVTGGEFEEVTIPHFAMEKELAKN